MTGGDRAFSVEPWCLTEESLDLGVQGRTESVFALANGHLGLRGNLDEGEPHGIPGTYLNSVFEFLPLPYAEAGYGYPQSGQAVINVTNGKLIRLLVDDEPFDVRYGELLEHRRPLDLRAGMLVRTIEWCSPAGQGVRIRSKRLVSFSQRAIAAIEYVVEPSGSRRASWSCRSSRPTSPCPTWARTPARPTLSTARCTPSTASCATAPRSSCIRLPGAGSGWLRRWTTTSRARRTPPSRATSRAISPGSS